MDIGNNAMIRQSLPSSPTVEDMPLSWTWRSIPSVCPTVTSIVIADRNIVICLTTGKGDLVTLLELRCFSGSNGTN